VFTSLANVIRGTGNMALPAIVTCAGAAVLVPLSPALIFGWGPFPRLEIAGGALFEVFVAQAIALATFGLIVAAAVAGGAWFGRLTWRGHDAALLLVGTPRYLEDLPSARPR
jgi:Na+-driven multidrug efflux pump